MRWGGGVPNRVPEVKKDSARNGTGEENSEKILESVPAFVVRLSREWCARAINIR